MNIVPLDRSSLGPTRAFFADLSPPDLTFVKEYVDNSDLLDAWAGVREQGRRWAACDGGEVVGFVSVLALPQWSRHVSELRLVVGPRHRRRGLGTRLAQHGLLQAVRADAEKIVVDAAASDVSTIAMFRGLGFTPEALLTDHIRDRAGEFQDLIVLAHQVGDVAAALDALGVPGELPMESGR